MPPRARISKEDILDKAFELLKSEGSASVTARRLATILGCSTHPVYQQFKSMDDLYNELYVRADRYFEEQVASITKKGKNEWLEEGVAFVKMAAIERNIYRFLFVEHISKINDIGEYLGEEDLELAKKAYEEELHVDNAQNNATKLSSEDMEELFIMVRVFTQGIASIANNCEAGLPENKIRQMLVRAYRAFNICKQ
jgi:AcrR family transcriptional regulator